MSRTVILAALALSACAPSHEAQLERRVADLEREIAELRASATAAYCKKTLSRAVPEAAQLSSPVPLR